MIATQTDAGLAIAGVGVISPASITHCFDALTHSPERRARIEVGALAERLNRFAATLAQWAEQSPGFDPGPDLDRFARKHVALTRAYWYAEGRCMYAFIVGPSKFPTARNRKRLDWADNARRAISYHCEAALKGVKRRAFPFGAPGEAIRSGDPDAIAKLKAERERVQTTLDAGKALNAAWRKAGKPLPGDDVAWSSIAETTKQPLASLADIRACLARAWAGCPPFHSANTSANLRRIDDRIASLGKMHARGVVETETPLGFRIVENADAARLQLLFPSKPDEKTRAVLKANGFRWAPSEGAWQRHLNNAGRYAVDCVKRELGAPSPAPPTKPPTPAGCLDLHGRRFIITAEFSTVDETNAYLLAHPGEGVIAERDGRIFVAAKSDDGARL